MKEDNEKFKEKIGLMKSLIEELKELRKVAKVQEIVEIKWTKTLFDYKQQQEALIKEKKEKENVLTYFKLINLQK